jgi:hypothetical protein
MQHLRTRTASMKTSVELVLTIVTNTAHVQTAMTATQILEMDALHPVPLNQEPCAGRGDMR